MAIVLRGLTECRICGEVINEHQAIATFPAFTVNEKDPLRFFSDGAFHENCVRAHPLYDNVVLRMRQWSEKMNPENRKCYVCEELIQDPDNYLLISHLTYNKNNPLYMYNYTHFHKTCIVNWADREEVIHGLKELSGNNDWEGEYLEKLIEKITRS